MHAEDRKDLLAHKSGKNATPDYPVTVLTRLLEFADSAQETAPRQKKACTIISRKVASIARNQHT